MSNIISINGNMSEALRLAEWVESDMTCEGDAEIAAELRRLVAENEALRADAAENLSMYRSARDRADAYKAINAELVEALRGLVEWAEHSAHEAAYAALAKVEASNG